MTQPSPLRIHTRAATPEDREMLIYSLFMEDDRYSVPTISIVMVESALRAREIAVRALEASPHHVQVEVRCGDDLLFTVDHGEVP
jgi:hypothetical protein